MGLAQPLYLLLLVAVAAMAYGVWRLVRWREAARREFAGPQARAWSSSRFTARQLLVLGAALLLVFAAARPHWGSQERFRELEGIDFVIALDVSQSMQAADVAPSRLAAAQEELVRLVEAEHGSRIGLVLFAGNAFLRSPLTSDTQAMVQLIRRAGQEAGLVRSGSDLGAALEVAGLVLSAGEENRGRAVILVSDGEDHAGNYAARAAALAEQGIALHTAGVGTPQGAGLFDRTAQGNLVPKVGADGRPVVTRLDESSLRAIADTGSGSYRRLGAGSGTLLDLRVDLRRLDPTPFGTDRIVTPVERYQWFVGGAMVLLLLSWFLPARLPLAQLRLRRLRPQPGMAGLLLALLLAACSSGDSLDERNREANRLFAEGRFQDALTIYQQLLAERPDIDELSYNAGNALHRLEAYERAIAETQRALPPNNVEMGNATYFSLGNHLLKLGRLEEAYLAYRAALLLDPADQDSKYNLEVTLLMLFGQPSPDGQGPRMPGDPGDMGQGSPQPGEGQPGEGEGTPEPGDPQGSPQAGGSPGPGGDMTPVPGEGPQRTLEQALAGLDEELSFEQAIEILDLLRQQQQRPRPSGGAGPGPDY